MTSSGFAASSEEDVTFTINGKKYAVGSDVPADTSLNTFIRNHANLKGTKFMCHEGGCGSCIVAVTSEHPFKEETTTYAVNSCLVNVFSCHGFAITTIEGIGSKKKGYHPVQARLAQFNGTQCGYCSPGMVMNMYSLLEGKYVTMKDIENSFGGNICRCTGYRPILDAFKSFAVDVSEDLKYKLQDIEELHKVKICPRNGKTCLEMCIENGDHAACLSSDLLKKAHSSLHIKLTDAEWYKVTKLEDIFEIFNRIDDAPYRLVAGNTGQGVFRMKEETRVFIDIGSVAELKFTSTEPNLTIGGNVSLTEAMNLFYSLSEQNKYKYTKVLADHIDLIANVPVRNTGTIAGNLCMKNNNIEFPSDIFLMLETVGATINVAEKGGKTTKMSLPTFLDIDLNHKIIHSIDLPELDDNYYLRTFKIMPRAQNAHAYINAGFLFKLKMNDNGKVLAKPTVVFGGINPQFIHASNTESYLNGKNLFERKILRTALKILDAELQLDYVLPDASPAYRKGLAEALFYKFVLGLSPPDLPPNLKSGGENLVRPLSTGKQEFDTNKSMWPLNKPIPKLEAVAQCSGEALYVNDMPTLPGELHGAFVLSTVGQGYIANIDPSEALNTTGVIMFFTAKDIPGKNSFIVPELMGFTEDEEIFCSGNVRYAGQPVGMIVANSYNLAHKAALKVKVEYSKVQKPQIDMREVIKSGDKSRLQLQGEIKGSGNKDVGDPAYIVKGSFDIGSQYHYTMETQTCVVIPVEDGLDVYPATQWMDLAQVAISRVLNIPESSININVRRLGGAYGSKISRSTLVITACALAAHLLNQPVRFVMNLETNMEAMGKRYSAAFDYEAGTDENGKILYLKGDFYEDSGHSWNEPVVPLTTHHIQNCYDTESWAIKGYGVWTDIASNTFCRAPSSTEGVAFIETVMEHIAKEIKKDPMKVRINNIDPKENTIIQLIEDMQVTSNYEARKLSVEEFNNKQRWKKRGIAMIPMTYGFPMWGNFAAIVSIYAQDGTVAVSHGGIEMGQGLNTKVAQVVAHTLNIPLEYVSIKPSNTLTSPNGMVTGGSITSEVCSYAAMVCCQELLKRMEPAKKELINPTWKEWTKAAYDQGIDLCATHMFTPKDDVKPYNIYGVTACEVEVDLLTGQHQILRVDIMEDAGESLSPEIDIGQVEGAFVMGLGYWLMEHLIYDPQTGRLLTNRTWNYKPPGVKDIPIDFRVHLRKNAPNPFGVLRSKATGEPPLCMSSVVLFALRNALDAARRDAGDDQPWYQMNAPATTENMFLTSLTNIDLFLL